MHFCQTTRLITKFGTLTIKKTRISFYELRSLQQYDIGL